MTRSPVDNKGKKRLGGRRGKGGEGRGNGREEKGGRENKKK